MSSNKKGPRKGTKPAKTAATAAKKTSSSESKKSTQPKPPRQRRTSALDAAAVLLAEASAPMSVATLIITMESRGLWKSPSGKTPGATLSAAIGREIKDKGPESRFQKADRGLFMSARRPLPQ